MYEPFSLSQSLSCHLSLSLSLSLNVDPPWEGVGAILGTTPHPAMLLYTISHHHALHHPHHDHHVYLYHDYHP